LALSDLLTLADLAGANDTAQKSGNPATSSAAMKMTCKANRSGNPVAAFPPIVRF
jgi:hypothetical protein